MLVICQCPFHFGTQNFVVSVTVSLDVLETQNKEYLLEGYLYPF